MAGEGTPDSSWPGDWRAVEEAGFLALPARHQERGDGAVWRASGRRNLRNSCVTLLEPPSGDIGDFLAKIETFSKAHAIDPVLRLPSIVVDDPACPSLERQLVARGWQAHKPSLVMMRPPEPRCPQPNRGQLEDLSLDAWLAEQAALRDEAPEQRRLFEELMRSVGPGLETWAWGEPDTLAPTSSGSAKSKFAGAKLAGAKLAGAKLAGAKLAGPRLAGPRSTAHEQAPSKVLASAMLFDHGGMMGLMNMMVLARARGLGVGQRFLAALLARTDALGRPVWLQVQADNVAAVALYRRAGFAPFYRYVYWRPVY